MLPEYEYPKIVELEDAQDLHQHLRWVKYYPGWVTTNSWESSGDLDITNPQTKENAKLLLNKKYDWLLKLNENMAW